MNFKETNDQIRLILKDKGFELTAINRLESLAGDVDVLLFRTTITQDSKEYRTPLSDDTNFEADVRIAHHLKTNTVSIDVFIETMLQFRQQVFTPSSKQVVEFSMVFPRDWISPLQQAIPNLSITLYSKQFYPVHYPANNI